MCSPGRSVLELLDRYQPEGQAEAADVARVRELARTAPDPWLRTEPLHLTGSAVIVHPDSGRVLLRWHQRHQLWLQVGGHGDPGETSALDIALREAAEETALTDLVPWPDAAVRHVAIVPVPASRTEPAHQHADIRFVLATANPQAARPEAQDAPLRWLTAAQAMAAAGNDNLTETLRRVRLLLAG